ncbi:transposase [Leuconostoc suionicum]|uniref:transposase n=1 Tax=Leuconostoc suionicum TaxID=1511761 RepID=UPI00300D4884
MAMQTVTSWVKKAQIIGTDVNGQPVTRVQFNAMQKEVARLKEENEILKIAAVLLGEHRK